MIFNIFISFCKKWSSTPGSDDLLGELVNSEEPNGSSCQINWKINDIENCLMPQIDDQIMPHIISKLYKVVLVSSYWWFTK